MMVRMKPQKFKNSLYLLLALLFIYIILFEFVLPINKVLPRPTILFESFLHLWTYYNLATALFSTAGIVYFSIAIGYLILWSLRGILIKSFISLKNSIESFRLFRYFPAFFFAILFAFWFNSSVTAQVIFGIGAFLFLSSQKIFSEMKNVKEEFLIVAENINPVKKYNEVIWNTILPELFNYMVRIHYYIWTLVLIYEYISDSFGLGSIYRIALEYNDLGAIVSLAIIISLLIWLGSFLIRLAKNKLAFWE